MQLPESVLTFIDQVNQLGYDIYLIGGAVRNYLLKLPVFDYDFATNCPLPYISHLYPLAEKDTQGKSFGNLKIKINQNWLSITLFRKDIYQDNHRYPSEIIYVDSLKEDVLRRDFTINAIAYHPQQGLIDYVDGIKDLNNKCLKTIIDPQLSFHQDALRILRAIRFASSLQFQLEANLLEAIESQKDLVLNLNPKFVDYEIQRMDLNYLETQYPQLYQWLVKEVMG